VELQGIYDLLVAIEVFCDQYSISEGGIMVGCANQGMLAQTQWFTEHVPCVNARADHLAKQELHHTTSMPSLPVMLDLLCGEQWAAYLPLGKITSDPQILVHDHLGWQAAQ